MVSNLTWDSRLPPDHVLYTPERLEAIADEARKPNSVFSLNDRIGIVQDSLALMKAGLLEVSAVFSLIDALRNENECKLKSRCVRVSGAQYATPRSLGLGQHLGHSCADRGYLVGGRSHCPFTQCVPQGEFTKCLRLTLAN